MNRRHAPGFRLILLTVDAVVAIATLVVVFSLRYGSSVPAIHPEAADWLWAPVVLYALLWVGVLYLAGEYEPRTHWKLRSEIVAIARATLWLALISMSLLLLVDLGSVSRLFLLALFPIQCIVTIACRALLRAGFDVYSRRGGRAGNLLIVGTGERAQRFAAQLERHRGFGLRIIGLVGDPPPAEGAGPYLGPVSALPRIFREQVVDEVALCLDGADVQQVRALTSICLEEGKIVRVPLDELHTEAGLRVIEDIDGLPVLSLVRGPYHAFSLGLKRATDIFGALVALTLLAPVIGLLALLILVADGRPILFRQTRVGVHGRPFTVLKLRTMVPEAEALYPQLAALSQTRGAAFKLKDDPRITRVGWLLRRMSLDELPQLWNVLKGDMSLVGPRPAPPREVDGYEMWHRRRLSMKPGLTGLWQVSSRLDEHFDDRARLDLYYIDHWSLALDLRIVARTLLVVIQAQGR